MKTADFLKFLRPSCRQQFNLQSFHHTEKMKEILAALLIVVALLAIAAHAGEEDDLSMPSRPNPLLHPNLAGRAVTSPLSSVRFAF
jgi:hypothetical protein